MSDHPKSAAQEKKEDELSAKPDSFLIVGIGASAGGVMALREFFEHVPPDSGMAYVAILHLSPEHDSQLTEVLQQVAKIPVTKVTERTRVRPNHVYVVPPDQHLMMEEDYIAVLKNTTVEDRRAPVDIFFRTLGDSHHARSVGVILSGTGANGSMGIKRIKERGGAAYVQNPREAEFNEMPRNSIATELIDEILPVREIPAKLIAYKQSLGSIDIPEEAEHTPEEQQHALREIFTMLRMRTGHDFSNYKRPTLLRRIERRINVRNLASLPMYAAYMHDHPEESVALLKDLLISVTNFYRDKKAFEYIQTVILPALISKKKAGESLRIWSIGCATGEEAYSLAMLCAEQTMGVIDAPKVQIFASDIDEEAIATAREGFYTLNDAADVSPERLRRFFNHETGGYRIRREIREMALFANQNVLKDPPFSHIDLVTCRNMLIYLNSTAQERVMETVHFALEPGGYLFLGSAESAATASDLFSIVSGEHHVFQSRIVGAKQFPVPEAIPHFRFEKNLGLYSAPESEPRVAAAGRISFGELHQQLLEEYAPPSIVVNEEYDIVHLTERAGRYLQVGGGEPSQNLLRLIRPELRLEVRTALYQAVQRHGAVEARNLKVRINDRTETINVHVRPVLQTAESIRGFILVLFEPAAETTEGEERTIVDIEGSMAQQLEDELIRVKSQLRSTVEQFELQNEELKASNEELQAMNEEMRSAAEELETSKEELQSINEELTTVNQELKVKVEELSLSSSNLQNLINSTDIGTIFLDRSFRVALFTPPARDIFNLIPADIGRPLSDITHRLAYADVIRDAELVQEKLTPVERETATTDGKSFLMRVLPYRTEEDRIMGVVLTFVDVTERKKAEEAMRRVEEQKAFLLALSDAIQPLTDPAKIVSEACRMLGEHLGVERAYFAEARPAERITIVRQDFVRGGLFSLSGTYPLSDFDWTMKVYAQGRPVVVPDVWTAPFIPEEARAPSAAAHVSWIAIPLVKEGVVAGSLCVADMKPRAWTEAEVETARETAERLWAVAERAHVEEALRASEERYRTLFMSMDEAYAVVEPLADEAGEWNDFLFVEVNPAFVKQTGMEFPEGRRATEMLGTPNPHWAHVWGRVAETGEPVRFEETEDTLGRTFDLYAFRLDANGPRRVAVLFYDITERKQRERNLTFLANLESRLASLTSPEEITETAGAAISEHFNVSHCLLVNIDEQMSVASVYHDHRATPDIPSLVGDYALENFHTAEEIEQLSAGQPIVVHDVFAKHQPAESAENFDAIDTRAFVTAPYVRNGQWRFAIGLQHIEPRQWREDEISFVTELATRVALRIERARAEMGLRESEEKYRTLFDTMDEGLAINEIVRDEHGRAMDARFLELNPAYERQTGFDRNTALTRLASEAFPDYYRSWLEVAERVVRTGKPERFEHFVSDNERWFSFHITPFGGADGFTVFYDNITERKQREWMQAYLLKLGDALRPLSDPAEIQRTAMQVVGEYLAVDRAMYAEITPEENTVVTDNYLSGRFPPFIGEFPLSAYGSIINKLRTGEQLVVADVDAETELTEEERTAYKVIGSTAFVTTPFIKGGRWVSNLVVHNGEPRRWRQEEIALLQETAERTWAAIERARIEEALRKSEANLSALFTAMPVGVALMDTKGKIVLSNAEMLRFLPNGVMPSQEPERLWRWKGYYPDGEGVEVQNFPGARAMRGESGGSIEFLYTADDGKEVWTRVNVLPVGDVSGHATGYVCVVTDIDELKRTAEALRQSEAKLAVELADTQQLQRVSSSLIEGDNTDAFYQTILEAARSIMRSDFASIQMLDPERGELLLLSHIGFAPESAEYWHWVKADGTSSCSLAMLREARVVVPDVEEWDIIAGTRDLEIYRLSGIRATQSTRLISRSGRLVGMISTHWRQPHQPAERELAVLDVLARQVADLLERRTAEEALRRSDEEKALLLAIGDAIRTLTDPAEIQLSAMRKLAEHLGLSRAYFFEVEKEGDSYVHVVENVYQRDPDGPDMVGRHSLETYDPALFAGLNRGEAAAVSNIATAPGISAEVRAAFEAIHIGAFVNVPLLRGDEYSAGIAAHDPAPREWTADEISLIREVGTHMWTAAERARAEEALRESEEKYRAVFESLDEGVSLLEVMFDEKGEAVDYRFVENNPAVERITGVSGGTGKTVRELFPDIDPAMVERTAAVAATGQPLRFQHTVPGLGKWFDVHEARVGAEGSNRVVSVFSDITNRKQAEEELQQAHARTAEILESIGDVFYALDKDYRYTYANRKAEETWGMSRKDVLGKTLWEVFPQIKGSESERMHIQAMESREVTHYEAVSTIVNRWLSVGIYPAANGGLSVYFRDIHDRKRAEESLRESEELMRVTMESAIDHAIITTDTKARITAWSKGAERIFGYHAQEVIGKNTDFTFVPEDVGAGIPEREMLIAREEGRALDERWHQHRDGNRMFLSGAMAPIRFNNRLIGYVKVARDITEQRKADEALRESEERQRIVLEAAGLSTWDWDVLADEVRWNEQHYLVLGLVPTEGPQYSEDFLRTVHPDDRPTVFTELSDAVKDADKLYQAEFRIIRADDGQIRWMAGYGKSMSRDAQGRATRMSGVMYDITARKEMEQRKDEFLGVASHELKTPLTAIKAYAEVLEEMVEDLGDAGAADVVRRLDDGINRLDRLIRDLLDATRINEGRMELRKDDVDVVALVREAAEEMQHTAKQRLEVEADEGLPLIRADRDRIRQVLGNVLSNAIKYSPESDRVVVRVSTKKKAVQICVEDFGVGISSDAAGKVFERFFREPDPGVSTFPGLGLGLYIANEIVELHGGTLTVKSRKGRGSTFCLTLPVGA